MIGDGRDFTGDECIAGVGVTSKDRAWFISVHAGIGASRYRVFETSTFMRIEERSFLLDFDSMLQDRDFSIARGLGREIDGFVRGNGFLENAEMDGFGGAGYLGVEEIDGLGGRSNDCTGAEDAGDESGLLRLLLIVSFSSDSVLSWLKDSDADLSAL